MKKLFYFFAIAALALGMASCGDEPESKDFQFQIETTKNAVHIRITPAKNEADYFYWIARVSDIDKAGSLEAYVRNMISKQPYKKWKNGLFILSGPDENTIDDNVDDIIAPDTRYVVYAFYVEEGTNGEVVIKSKIASKECQTLPEAFQIKLHPMSNSLLAYVTPLDNEQQYLIFSAYASKVDAASSVEEFMSKQIQGYTFDQLLTYMYTGKQEFYDSGLTSNTEMVLIVYCIDETKKITDIVTRRCTTMPQFTLPGEFSVSATKKVHFTTGNVNYVPDAYRFADHQWSYVCKTTGETIDLFPWTKIAAMTATSDYFVLSPEEWWYLFRDRPGADTLFAHATVNGKHGVIILPDNWEMPEGGQLKTDKELGFTWDDYRYKAPDDFDGYAQNVFDGTETIDNTDLMWRAFECCGAVFLPAAGVDGVYSGLYGHYWSSAERENRPEDAYGISFEPNALSVDGRKYSLSKTSHLAIRLVRVVE